MNGPYRFGRFELNPATRQLFADSGQVTLGARAFDVLVALIERRDRMVTKDQLLESAWPGLVVEEGNLDVQISALRKALGPGAIATIRGRGYRFALQLESDPEPAPERSVDAPERRKEPRPWLIPSQSEGPRLAAVLFTDVVGYSSRMQKDEKGTIALVKADFERMRLLCGKHGGEALNTMGDGLLLCFPSALQGVSCALEIQTEFTARRASTPPEQALEHRIGVHLGDVFHLDTGDVAGDGINIASRLESKAPPGGICLSQTIYDTVKGKLPMRSRFIGPETFKNIAEPVLIWQVLPQNASEPEVTTPTEASRTPRRLSVRCIAGGAAALALLATAGAWYWTRPPAVTWPDAKSIAVLPFLNMSEDKDAAYFADGVQDDLLTQLALLGDLKVVSRTSVAEYRDSKKNARQIAAELGVASLVEGSVRRAGNRVRISAQLIDARTDKHLWAASYDRELKDIFAIQTELSTEIARALKVSLGPKERQLLARKPTENLEAYELFLRSVSLELGSHNFSPAYKLEERIALLSRAVELDPKFALAWARLGAEHARVRFFDSDFSDARLAKARQAIDRALALAPDDAAVKGEAGYYYYYGLGDYPRAAGYLEDLLQRAPNNVEVLRLLSLVKRRQGRWLDAVSVLERSVAIDPRNLAALRSLRANFEAFRHWDEALALHQRILAIAPDNLDELAILRELESKRSGSFASYDVWRKTLPADALERSPMTWLMDLKRAVAHADVDSALRLYDAPPQVYDFADKKEYRAMMLLAKGERSRAHEVAREALLEANAELKQNPRNAWAGMRAFLDLAVLGGREAAIAAHGRWAQLKNPRSDVLAAEQVLYYKVIVLAVLGDRDGALQLIEPFRQRPTGLDLAHLVHLVALVTRQADARSQKLAEDFKAPIPIANWGFEEARPASLAPAAD